MRNCVQVFLLEWRIDKANDNFKKIIIVKSDMKHWFTEEGILIIGIKEFLLNKNSLDL